MHACVCMCVFLPMYPHPHPPTPPCPSNTPPPHYDSGAQSPPVRAMRRPGSGTLTLRNVCRAPFGICRYGIFQAALSLIGSPDIEIGEEGTHLTPVAALLLPCQLNDMDFFVFSVSFCRDDGSLRLQPRTFICSVPAESSSIMCSHSNKFTSAMFSRAHAGAKTVSTGFSNEGDECELLIGRRQNVAFEAKT